MSLRSKSLKNKLNIRLKGLSKVILLCESPHLARTVKKDQGNLITIANCPLSVYKRRVAPVELVLYISWAGSLPLLPYHPLLYSPPSNQKYNLV